MKRFCLITGASGGIGLEFARIFARNGHDLILTARSSDKLKRLKYSLEKRYKVKVHVISADLTSAEEIERLYREASLLGQVDILVNNAGFGDFGPFLDSDLKKQQAMIDLNIAAVMRLSYLFGNGMRGTGGGRIINIASAAAFAAGPYMSMYYAAKSFVLSFSQALSEELKGYNISVTALCPGPTDTDFEHNADMDDSVMFSVIKPASAKNVARAGYSAAMNNRSIRYHGIVTYLFNIASRLLPRNVSIKLSLFMNRKV